MLTIFYMGITIYIKFKYLNSGCAFESAIIRMRIQVLKNTFQKKMNLNILHPDPDQDHQYLWM
jgi:hypothetical protein